MILIFKPGIGKVTESMQHVFVKNCLRETARLSVGNINANINDLWAQSKREIKEQ